MKIFEEITGILGGYFMLLSFSKDPSIALSTVYLSSIIGIIVSFLFYNKYNIKKTAIVSLLSFILSSAFGVLTLYFIPQISIWVACSLSFLINFIFFRRQKRYSV